MARAAPDTTIEMQHKHDIAHQRERHMAGRRFRQQSGCHAGEVVHVLGEAPHFDGYWLVEAECGKRWAMRERVLRSRLRQADERPGRDERHPAANAALRR
jgi:hypothetical protein